LGQRGQLREPDLISGGPRFTGSKMDGTKGSKEGMKAEKMEGNKGGTHYSLNRVKKMEKEHGGHSHNKWNLKTLETEGKAQKRTRGTQNR